MGVSLGWVRRYDVIVAGAGPAGSVTAYRLASAGAAVLLLDRAKFPRDKPCGGGLTYRAVRELPFSVEPVVEDVVDRFEFGFRYGHRFERRGASPIILMTQRRRLDAFLAEQAAAAGAEFRDGTKATAVSPDGTVSVDGATLTAPVVVGADGVNGVSVRSLGLERLPLRCCLRRQRSVRACFGTLPRPGRARARHSAGRVRLGVREGRPRQRRRRRLGVRGAAAAPASSGAVSHARHSRGTRRIAPRVPPPAAPPTGRARARPPPTRWRRRRPRRPSLRRRNVRGVRQRASRRRRRARPAAWPTRLPGAVRVEPHRRARLASCGVLGGEARAGSLPAARLRVRSNASGVALRGRAPTRRAQVAERRARSREGAAEGC